ncbi:hypothetical protein [Candidatus Frankia alpina]|uniref:Uncharacterized protein n=1 Tax=Candidatus Frankia alpina TaxID=2699483 RepID=A0A4V3Z7H3_9ACTN|nr:hypothetical protein [Candidatus Frankia alpina]THJ74199.1 hypothetical protein E7Y31_12910 [Candidatus Frankia alpina]
MPSPFISTIPPCLSVVSVGVRPYRPDTPPPLDPDAPIPDDPGPLLPDTPDLPPAPHEPSPYTEPAPNSPEPEPEPV